MNKTIKTIQPHSGQPIRNFILIFLPVAILHCAISISFYLTATKSKRDTFSAQEAINVRQQEKIIRHDIVSITSNLTVLSENYLLQRLLSAGWDPNLNGVSKDFLSFIRHKKRYDQLRYIDKSGMEIIRVSWNNGAPATVPDNLLQNKSKRYYFMDTISLDKGKSLYRLLI